MSDTNLNDASFTPEINDSEESTNKQTYSATGSFRFWCQKVLPLVYDDSLSYYELLCKVVNYLNNVIQNVDNLNTSVDNTNTAFNNLQNYVNTTKDTLVEVYGNLEQYVNDYFNNLDVQDEINAKLDEMAIDGSLSAIINPLIPHAVSDWLGKNISPTTPAIDKTLTVANAGADAKVTGDMFSYLNYMNNIEQGTFENVSGSVKKVPSNVTLRTIVPFYAKKGVTFEAKEGCELYLITWTYDWECTGNTNFVQSYTMSNDRYGFLACRKTDLSSITPNDLSDILTQETINIIIRYAITGLYADEKDKAIRTYIDTITYVENFESGSFNNNNGNIEKRKDTTSLRTMTPFYIEKDSTIKAKDNCEFYLVTYDNEWNYTGTTGFTNEYTLAHSRYGYLACRKTNQSEVNISDINDILTSNTVYLINHNAVISGYTKAIADNISDRLTVEENSTTARNYLTNFEPGVFSRHGGNYEKYADNKTLRSITPFYAKKGTTITAKPNCEVYLTTYDMEWNCTGSTNFVQSYTLSNDRYCMLACRKSDLSEISLFDLNDILDEASIYTVNHNAVWSIYTEEYFKAIYPSFRNKYIVTNVNIGARVSLNRLDYIGYYCYIIPCKQGDAFTITGCGGGSGRLWAFIDSEYNLISKSLTVGYEQNHVIKAPANAKYLIINVNSDMGYSVSRGENIIVNRDFKKNVIRSADIHDLPKDIVSMPVIAHSARVGERNGVSVAKGAVYKNGDYYCITYGENLDNTTDDFPRVSATGTLAMKYKFFKLVNEQETEVSYGTFAKLGDTYTDYNGTTKQFTGGCGLPSGNNGIQYFTSAFTGTKRYNGIDNYGMTPCCCAVNVGSNGVTFGEIHELSLTINGTSGKFDLSRINSENVEYSLYITTAPPCYKNGIYHWIQPGKHSLIYLTSTNGIDWEYKFSLDVDFEPTCEVATAILNDRIICAVRTWGNKLNRYTESVDYICVINTAGNFISMYSLNFVSTRSYLVNTGNDILMFYTPYNKNIVDCIRITNASDNDFSEGLHFLKWFTIYNECTWYIACNQDSVTAKNFSDMYLVGGNDPGPRKANGMTFMHLTFDTSKPKDVNDIGTMVI